VNRAVPKNDEKPTTADPRKMILGLLSAAFLLGAAIFFFWPPVGNAGREWEAACFRIGPIFAVLWLAYDDIKRIPWWLWVASPVVLFVLFKWKYLVLLLIPIIAVVAILKPRLKRR
jgi:hypothetical protein